MHWRQPKEFREHSRLADTSTHQSSHGFTNHSTHINHPLIFQLPQNTPASEPMCQTLPLTQNIYYLKTFSRPTLPTLMFTHIQGGHNPKRRHRLGQRAGDSDWCPPIIRRNLLLSFLSRTRQKTTLGKDSCSDSECKDNGFLQETRQQLSGGMNTVAAQRLSNNSCILCYLTLTHSRRPQSWLGS